MSIDKDIIELGRKAKTASLSMKICNSDQKNLALTKLTKNLDPVSYTHLRAHET